MSLVLKSITFDFSTDDMVATVVYKPERIGYWVMVIVNGEIVTSEPTHIGGQSHYAEAELNYAISKTIIKLSL